MQIQPKNFKLGVPYVDMPGQPSFLIFTAKRRHLGFFEFYIWCYRIATYEWIEMGWEELTMSRYEMNINDFEVFNVPNVVAKAIPNADQIIGLPECPLFKYKE